MSSLAIANLVSAKRYDPDQPRTELRRLFLIERRHTIKETAADMGVSDELLRQWICGQRDLPAKHLGPLYLALGKRLNIITAVLQGTDLSVVKRTPATVSHRPVRLLEQMVILVGDIMQILGKYVRGEKLTREELRQLKEDLSQLHLILEEIEETAEQEGEKP